ncbi:growth hormone secretagogue receptor type 1 [Biomphalaria pfeifferi]|uniref:Growth hormone secretagogue receptor type 1 n=1 Tax=Biomphalaria pfeifferi TaxID=112525 RepID=A0AAD8FCT2_BIOPF|nr:growth hormone secretagogue receptor type 1 [Biomphalaria pfeifferi]
MNTSDSFLSSIGTTDQTLLNDLTKVYTTVGQVTRLSTVGSSPSTTPCPVDNFACQPLIIAAVNFNIYGAYVAYALGIPGNALACIILAKMKPFNSSIIWLIILTFTDFLNLTMRFVNGRVPGYEDWSCRMFYIFGQTFTFTSYLYVLGLTCERFIAVQFPLKMNQWCTIRRSILAVFICLVICLGQSLYVIEVYRANFFKDCVLREKYKDTWGYLYENFFQTTVLKLLPIVLLILLNILIVRRLNRAKKVQSKMTESLNKDKARQQKQINRMLTASSICLFICVMPEILYCYCNPLIEYSPFGNRSRIILINVYSVMKLYNSALNFLLYFIAASKFRSEFLSLVTCNRFGRKEQTGKSTLHNVTSVTKTTSVGYSPTVS